MKRLRSRNLLGMSAPLAIWALHFVIVYALQAIACRQGWHVQQLAGRDSVVWGLMLLTALAMLATFCLGLRAWRRRRATAANSDTGGDAPPLDRFMATLTTAIAALATIAIAFTGLPLLILSTCH